MLENKSLKVTYNNFRYNILLFSTSYPCAHTGRRGHSGIISVFFLVLSTYCKKKKSIALVEYVYNFLFRIMWKF